MVGASPGCKTSKLSRERAWTREFDDNLGSSATQLSAVRGRRKSSACALLAAAVVRRTVLDLWVCLPAQFPTYEQLVSEFAWEKTRAIEKQRRKRQSPLLQALDERTRWRTALLGDSLALLFRQIFPLGRVLDVGCGSGRRVPEPFIPFGIQISRALFEQADAHMRGRGGWAVHAPALKGIGQFQTGYFSGIVLRSFLEHEVAPKAVLQEFCASSRR